jgi:hypothetical protein
MGLIQVSEPFPQAEIEAVAAEIRRWQSNGCCTQGVVCRNCDCNPECESRRANDLAIAVLRKRQEVETPFDTGDEYDD